MINRLALSCDHCYNNQLLLLTNEKELLLYNESHVISFIAHERSQLLALSKTMSQQILFVWENADYIT